ncbi:MAG TPA: class I SAM-dependent methyltransferase [Nitrospirae bacterium]|nr:class I SAM-dependent methyltransferase [Nitrospirota bacterium]
MDLLERDANGYVFLRSSVIYKDDDRTLSIYKSIVENGFSNIESSFSPIILGYSTETGRYNAISGRHRIAALRYLRAHGDISGSLKIKCHLVGYPYDSLVVSRPYKGHCMQCNWGNIYDPGSGTHQDFFMREGVAVMRGRAGKKGGRQKWDIIEPVFREAVSDKKVLDIGAYRGLYCLKALEFGARHATALELSASLASVIETIKKRYVLDDLELIQGDFYDNECYDALADAKYDTVFLFGVIHHLLRLGIQQEILHSFDELFERISRIANYGVIIEFAMPRESSLEQPGISSYRDAFSQNAFEQALQKHFPKYNNLGRCNYKSGNRFGRFMYYGIKQ